MEITPEQYEMLCDDCKKLLPMPEEDLEEGDGDMESMDSEETEDGIPKMKGPLPKTMEEAEKGALQLIIAMGNKPKGTKK